MFELVVGTAPRIVRLRFIRPPEPGDAEAYFDALDRLVLLPPGYGLLVEMTGEHHLDQAQDRRQALWFKANRQRLDACCRALAIWHPEASGRMQSSFERLFAFPVLVTRSEQSATRWLLQHLADSGAKP